RHASLGCAVSHSLFFFQAEDGIRDATVTGVQTCALPISCAAVIDQNKATMDAATQATRGFLRDVMSDNTGAISLHRFQMFVWTRSEERRVGKECRYGRSEDN